MKVPYISVLELSKKKGNHEVKGYKIASKEEFERVLREELEKRKEIYLRIAKL